MGILWIWRDIFIFYLYFSWILTFVYLCLYIIYINCVRRKNYFNSKWYAHFSFILFLKQIKFFSEKFYIILYYIILEELYNNKTKYIYIKHSKIKLDTVFQISLKNHTWERIYFSAFKISMSIMIENPLSEVYMNMYIHMCC